MFSLTFLTGCSSFGRDYKRAVAAQRPADSIDGPWTGTWTSNGGHAGTLKCLLTRNATPGAENGVTTYRARFEATFWKIFTAHYDVTLHGKEEASGASAHLTGDQKLAKMFGGVFHYDAKVTPTNFDATYESSKDDGKFVMTRP